MAQAYRRLGAEVTLVEGKRLLGRDDPELVAIVRAQLIEDGVTIHEETPVTAVEADGAGIALTCGSGDASLRLSGSHLLVAAGRRPKIDGLGLEDAGVALNDGVPLIDARLRTTNKRIFAIGDVVGPYRFTHTASYQARIVITNALFRLPARVRYDAVPWVTYTDPELAHVGLSEAEARAKGNEVRILRFPFEENDRAIAEGATRGLVEGRSDTARPGARRLHRRRPCRRADPPLGPGREVPAWSRQAGAGDRALPDAKRGKRARRRELPCADAVRPAHQASGPYARPPGVIARGRRVENILS